MPNAMAEKNLARYDIGHFIEDDAPFCLSQIAAYETDDPGTSEKIDDLLEGRVASRTKTSVERACNLGGCTLKISESVEDGRVVSGACKVADYCLKKTFAAVGEAPTVDEGRALYRDIIDNLESFTSEYSAGNFCPRLDCGLSAGVTIDGNSGTTGDCASRATTDQLPLDFDQPA